MGKMCNVRLVHVHPLSSQELRNSMEWVVAGYKDLSQTVNIKGDLATC